MRSFSFFILALISSLLTPTNSFKTQTTFKKSLKLTGSTFRQAKIVGDAEEYQIVTLDGHDYNG
jgi:hypothetical protein